MSYDRPRDPTYFVIGMHNVSGMNMKFQKAALDCLQKNCTTDQNANVFILHTCGGESLYPYQFYLDCYFLF